MPERELVKIDEELKLSSGVTVEYYCTQGGPSLSLLMDQVMKIATDSLIWKMS